MFDRTAIKEHMHVVGSDGSSVGKVDRIEGASHIKLTRTDSPDGKHHFIPVSWIDRVDQKVHLNKSAKDAQSEWQSAA